METRNLENLEILRAGNWNGVEWSVDDIDRAIENFNAGVAKIPLKVTKDGTHESQPLTLPGGAALGFVDALKRVGDRLVASVKQVPKFVAELIASVGGVGALPTPSIEGWVDFETADGDKHGRVIDGVILFGVHLPAVHGLEGLAALYQAPAQTGVRFACCADTAVEMKRLDTGSQSARDSRASDSPPATDTGTVAAAPVKQTKTTENKKGQKTVDKIELTLEEHKTLYEASLRLSSVTADLAQAKERLTKAEADRLEFQKKHEESEKLLTEYRAKEVRIECERVGAAVEEQVKAGRLEPAKKEDTIAYILTLKIEDRLAYVKKLENLPTLFGEVANVPGAPAATGNEFDQVHDKAIALQATTGMTYEESSAVIMQQMGG